MKTRKLGLFGLVIAAGILSACEPTTTTTVVTDTTPTITVNVVPDTATLVIAQTRMLVAVVTGSANQAVTWSTSAATIANVSATGLVTAVAIGTAVISAVSTADARARDASVINVIAAPVVPTPSIVITSITTGTTNTPVNTQNVTGQIDITAELNVPQGAVVQRVEFLMDNGVLANCTQTFTAGGSADIDPDQAMVPIICSVDTALFNAATGVPTFPNGPHTISARVVNPAGTVTASSSQNLAFNNPSFIIAAVTFLNAGTTTVKPCVNSGTNARSQGGPGTLWCGGDVRVALTTVNFGAASNAVATATIGIMTSGVGVSGAAGCRTATPASDKFSNPTIAYNDDGAGPGPGNFPGCPSATASLQDITAADGFSLIFSSTNNPDASTNGVANIEDFVTVIVNSTTVGGQAGPVCVNPDPSRNPLSACGSGIGGSAANIAFFQNPIRLDVLAPRVTLLDITPTVCASVTAGCYVNAAFSFTTRTGFYASVDYGVDSQVANTIFEAGTSATALTAVTTAATLPETMTATEDFLRVTARDGLANARLLFATTVNTTTTTSSTAATVQKFGVDKTSPAIVQPPVTPPNNGANDGLAFIISVIDTAPAGAGPSGPAANPVIVRLERINAAGTTCFNAYTGGGISCTTGGNQGNGTQSGSGIFAPGIATAAYIRVTYFGQDGAGNVTANFVVLTLLDVAAPTAGSLATPSIITGGASTTVSAAVSDNVELGTVLSYTTYGTGDNLQEGTAPTAIGAYGPDAFTTSGTATVTIPSFLRSIEFTDEGSVPAGVGPANRAQLITFLVRDAAGQVDADPCPFVGDPDDSNTQNCRLRTGNIASAVNAGIPATGTGAEVSFGTVFPGPNVQTFTIAVNNTNLCNGDNAGGTQSPACPTNPTSATFTLRANGPVASFANPFLRVNLYYTDPATGRSVLIGTNSSPGATGTVAIRTFTWTISWNPAGLAADDYTVFAIGVNSSGQGLRSGDVVITVNID